jgi:hypothetical protein
MCQNLVAIVIFYFSIGKAAMNAPCLCKECLTGIGQGTTLFVAVIPNVNEI